MDSKRIEPELSLHLDGRLPSGRRENVLDRAADDPAVSSLLAEMERARDLARSLPAQQVSGNFTRDLWERIRSGEGTPEAVFREPLPLWTKVRYVATGAAAAAVVIFGMSLFRGAEIEPTPENTQQVAHADTAPQPAAKISEEPHGLVRSPHQGGLTPVGAGRYALPEVLPVNAESLARAGRAECIDAMRDLQRTIPSVEREVVTAGIEAATARLNPLVERARGPVDVIRWLQGEQLVKLNREFDSTLTMAEQILNRIDRAKHHQDRELLLRAAQDIRELELDRLDRDFDVVCCKDPTEFLGRLRDQLMCNPAAFRFGIEAVSPDPFNMNLLRPGAETSTFVAPGSSTIQIQIVRRR